VGIVLIIWFMKWKIVIPSAIIVLLFVLFSDCFRSFASMGSCLSICGKSRDTTDQLSDISMATPRNVPPQPTPSGAVGSRVTEVDVAVVERGRHATVPHVQPPPAVSAAAAAVAVATAVTETFLYGTISHVADGDTVVFLQPVSESEVPQEIRALIVRRREARSRRAYNDADRMRSEIQAAHFDVDDKTGVVSRHYRVRLFAIDAPETKQAYGPESQAFLREMVEKQPGALVIRVPHDQYGRTVAELYVGPPSGLRWVQEAMLRSGNAWHYRAYDKRAQLDEWEQEARSARRGLWAQGSPQAPWEWRKQHQRT
jgi:endonuclease YncB( thermonuclease family)